MSNHESVAFFSFWVVKMIRPGLKKNSKKRLLGEVNPSSQKRNHRDLTKTSMIPSVIDLGKWLQSDGHWLRKVNHACLSQLTRKQTERSERHSDYTHYETVLPTGVCQTVYDLRNSLRPLDSDIKRLRGSANSVVQGYRHWGEAQKLSSHNLWFLLLCASFAAWEAVIVVAKGWRTQLGHVRLLRCEEFAHHAVKALFGTAPLR